MKKKAMVLLLWTTLCLLMMLTAADAETRQGVIALEGMEETIEETRFESPQGFSFWYASEGLKAYQGEAGGMDGAVVASAYTDDYMVLSVITEEEAGQYAKELGIDIEKQSASSRVQEEIYLKLEDRKFRFLTLIAEGGRYLRAAGEYAMEAAEGTGKYFQRIMGSVEWTSDYDYDAEFLKELPGKWAEEYESAGTVLTLEENGEMSLYCYGVDGSFAYTSKGTWAYEPVPEYTGQLTLRFTSTDNPSKAGSEYLVECAYAAYTESSVENDTLVTYLILNPPTGGSGTSPFEEVYGYDGVTLHREQGPNMRVVNCKQFVSLRETKSKESKRLAKVPLGAMVLAFPEAGQENGFTYCVYHGQEGYILSEYLQPAGQ